MKKKLLPLTLALLGCLALPASGDILIPNGDFSDGSTGWLRVDGTGQGPAVTSASGGNLGGYASITPGGGWGILVTPTVAGASGGGIPIASLGLTAGSQVTFRWDSINLGAPGSGVPAVGTPAGIKIEAWAANAIVGNTGDVRPSTIGNGSTWETYNYIWTLPGTTEKVIIVPLWSGNSSVVGIDNVGVVPEPSTYALLALGAAGLGGHLIRRRHR